MSEWDARKNTGRRSRKPKYPDLTDAFVDPVNDVNVYEGASDLIGYYRFIGRDKTVENRAAVLNNSGSLGSAVYYEDAMYGNSVNYTPSEDGTFSSQVTPYLPGKDLVFSGSKDDKNYFRISDTSAWNCYPTVVAKGGPFTIAAWVRLPAGYWKQQSDTAIPIISKVQNGATFATGGEIKLYYSIASSGATYIDSYLFTSNGNYHRAISGYIANYGSNTIEDSTSTPQPMAVNGKWIHIALTWDGGDTDSGGEWPVDGADAMQIFVNGVHATRNNSQLNTFTGIRPPVNATPGDILINRGDNDNSESSTYFGNQDVAEVAIWSRKLAGTEISAIYNAQKNGIRDFNSGIITNPPRVQLQRLDDTAGNAYPTIGGSADQRRLGKRTPHFDDTLTRIFTQSYTGWGVESTVASGSEPIMMGTRMRVTDPLLSASFSTPNKLPTIVVSGSNTFGIDARIMGNLPFLTASVTQFKDRYKPFVDNNAPYRGDGDFYVTGSQNIPSFDGRLADKIQVTIPLNNTKVITFGMNAGGNDWGADSNNMYDTGGGASNYGEFQLMVYWNAKDSRWEKMGRGLTFGKPEEGGYPDGAKVNAYFSQADPLNADTPNTGWTPAQAGTGTNIEGFQQRNVNFGCAGFGSVQGQVISRRGLDEGGGFVWGANEVIAPALARPTTTYGFPFDARYQATGSQLINMSDYIDAPFLLEKCEWHYSGSIYVSTKTKVGNLMLADNQGPRPNGPGTALAIPPKVCATSFFILRQRPGVFEYQEKNATFFGIKQDGTPVVANKTLLTSSIPGRRCTNMDGINKHDTFEIVHDTRDLITYDQQITVFQSSSLSDPSYKGTLDDFDINGDTSPTSISELLEAGMGRELNIVVDGTIGIPGNPLTIKGNPDSGGWTFGGATNSSYPGYHNIRGSFVLLGNVKSTAIQRNSTTGMLVSNFYNAAFPPDAAQSGYAGKNQATQEIKNMIGGRMNPESALGDRRPFINSVPSGLTSSQAPLIAGSTSYGGNQGYTIQAVTASAASTFAKSSPYILMPGDNIIIGCHADTPFNTKAGWDYDDVNAGGSAYFAGITLPPAPGKLVLYGSYIKNHKQRNNSLNQQLTTNAVHNIISNGPVYDQWEINAVSAYSGSYLGRSITGSMTSPVIGWPREPAFRASSFWASASSTPRPGGAVGTLGITGSAYSDTGGPFDGGIKPWVSSSAYHSSSLYGRYFSSYIKPGESKTSNTTPTPTTVNRIIGGGVAPDPSDDPLNKLIRKVVAREPSTTREVAATVYQSLAVNNKHYARRSPGDVFGFQRNIRLNCEEETYYDSLVPDPAVCWAADNQPKGYAGGVIATNMELGSNVELGIGASNAGSHAGKELPTDAGESYKEYPDYTTPGAEWTFYTNEWWLASFPFEARYRGFTEPPTDEYKRRTKISPFFQVRLCAPYFDQDQPWNGFLGLAGSTSSYGDADNMNPGVVAQSAGCKGVVTIYVDGKKPGLQRSPTAYTTPATLGFTTSVDDVDGTVLPVLFGFGRGISGSVSPWKRTAGTDAQSVAGDNDLYDGSYKYISNKPSGCKYGLYSWKPRLTSTIFRSTRFGQFRDMLEQRRYTRFFLKEDGAVEVSAPIFCQFKEPAWLAPTEDTDKTAVSTQCSNLSTFATASVPYFDGEVKNRGPLIADGSDTIVIE